MNFPLIIDARKEIEKYFDKLCLKYEGKDTRQILIDYFSLKHKLISCKKRSILKANHLEKKVESIGIREVFDDIQKKILEGTDLNPHLSTRILKPNNHDFILNEWKLHHLHLTNEKINSSDYFVKRGDYLLFIHVQDFRIYLIDIIPHADKLVFAKKEFIRIIKRNWNDLHNQFLFGGGNMQLLNDLSELEIAKYRKQKFGLLMVTQVDDETYMPGSGSTTSGHSLEAMRNFNAFCRRLYDIQNILNNSEEQIKKNITKQKGIKLKSLNFTVKLENGIFRIYENYSKSYIA